MLLDYISQEASRRHARSPWRGPSGMRRRAPWDLPSSIRERGKPRQLWAAVTRESRASEPQRVSWGMGRRLFYS